MSDKDKITLVFIVGSARSGTTILGKLLSAHPSFATYRAETLLLQLCRLKYGNIFVSDAKKACFLKDWFLSRQFKRSNLTREEFLYLVDSSSCYEELLVAFLKEMAAKSDKKFILDSTPSNIYYVDSIREKCPDAKFVRIMRDGRDVAISQVKLGWANPPWPFRGREDALHYSVINWAYTQRHFERITNNINCKKVSFESLVEKPEALIFDLAHYIGVDPYLIKYQEILEERPNTAFASSNVPPVGRWRKEKLKTINKISFCIGATLYHYGYEKTGYGVKPICFIRYLYFSFHIRFKRFLSKYYLFSRYSSQKLEHGD